MSTSKTIIVAGLLCLFCSAIVSVTAVQLKPLQVRNQELDMKKNILQSAGMLKDGENIEEAFKAITPIRINISTGETVKDLDKDALKESVSIPRNIDQGGLVSMEQYPEVYLEKSEDGSIQSFIIPIISKGLWSTMRGFMALASDMKTVKGFSYYSHGETPGLGGEVDNPKWKKSWIGKVLYNQSWNPQVSITKNNTGSNHEVDALSGATITGNGVQNSLKFWLSNNAYGKFFAKMRQGAY